MQNTTQTVTFYTWSIPCFTSDWWEKRKKAPFTCFFTTPFVGVKLISCKCPNYPRKVLHPVHN